MPERVSLDRLINEIEQSVSLLPTWPEEEKPEAIKRVAGLVGTFQDQVTRKAIAWQATARALRGIFKDPVSADAVEAVLRDLANRPPEEMLVQKMINELVFPALFQKIDVLDPATPRFMITNELAHPDEARKVRCALQVSGANLTGNVVPFGRHIPIFEVITRR